MPDRRRIDGVEDALRRVMSHAGTNPTRLAKENGIGRNYIFSAYKGSLITGKTMDVAKMCGYRLAFVPDGAGLPEGSVLLPDRPEIDPSAMPKREAKPSSGYVQYL